MTTVPMFVARVFTVGSVFYLCAAIWQLISAIRDRRTMRQASAILQDAEVRLDRASDMMADATRMHTEAGEARLEAFAQLQRAKRLAGEIDLITTPTERTH